ncbi:MAG: GNAT family N-acetyltransferase [Flavobacteriaceae bacterium]|nr:GNAT family N-acetyltransferase [Flavobacteriaceae bacterium]MCY4217438.1 GNAT family N-acetyltransferase [Flavobacteriaceae bacterium]MCY4254248.1 GNAT family N-acetyltransferase [Flavobacteriaceae bacterium]
MNIKIRKATIDDCPSIHKLVIELSIFEKEAHQVTITIEDLKRDGFSENSLFECFVALLEEKIVGMALFYPRYSTWKGPTFHLEDLIVQKEYTHQGIGTQLFKKFITYAYRQGAQRIEWAVLDWNENAIDFYKKSGAEILEDWRVVQMTRQQMNHYLNHNSESV